jgi:hypothetical protein
MKKFETKVDGYGDKIYSFDCYENTEHIGIGDKFIFFFAGIADVQECCSEREMYEINKNDRVSGGFGDMVTGFWRNCYKIKHTDFDLTQV